MSRSDCVPTPVRRAVIFVFAFLTLFPALLHAGTNEPRFIQHGSAVASEYIVALPADTPPERVEVLARALARDYRLTVVSTFHEALSGFHCRASLRAAKKLAKDTRVVFVEEDFTMTVSSMSGATVESQAYPAPLSWTLHRITHRTPIRDSTYSYPRPSDVNGKKSDGKGVVAYIFDTGVYQQHKEFLEVVDGVEVSRVEAGHNAIEPAKLYEATSPCGGNGPHGTAVASLLGGKTMGVAPGVTIVPVKVVPCVGPWDLIHTIAGLDWILTDLNHQETKSTFKGAVLNMSYEGAPLDAPSFKAALARAVSRGVVPFAAAGNFPNGGGDSCRILPAGYGYNNDQTGPHVIVTSGINSADTRESGCTADQARCGLGTEFGYGQCVDLFAPATETTAAGVGLPDSVREEQRNGTSFASPMTAGVAARLMADYNLYSSGHRGKTFERVWQMLRDTATRGVVQNLGGSDDHPPYQSPNRLLYIEGRRITTQPQSIVVPFSNTDTTNLTVVANVSSSATYQWYEGAYGSFDALCPTPEDPTAPCKIAGATSATFPAPRKATKSYWVRIKEGDDTADSLPATVTVCTEIRPSITLTHPDPNPQNLVRLEVNDKNGTSYEWYVGRSGDTSRRLPGSFLSSDKHDFVPHTTNDYWVRVRKSSSCDLDSDSVRIDVCEPPKISVEPASQTFFYDVGSTGNVNPTLSVTATGSDLDYQWYTAAGAPVPSYGTTPEKTGKGATYAVPFNAQQREQTFYVVVSSYCGPETDVSANATISFWPKLEKIYIRDPNQPLGPAQLLDQDHLLDQLHKVVVLPKSEPIYVPFGGSVALTAQPAAFYSLNEGLSTKAAPITITDTGGGGAATSNLAPALSYYAQEVSQPRTITATAKQANNLPVTGSVTIEPCGPRLTTGNPMINAAGRLMVTLSAAADVEWFRGTQHDDHLKPVFQAHYATPADAVLEGTGLSGSRYWARVIGTCDKGRVTEDTVAVCLGRCRAVGHGVVRVNGVASAFYRMNGQPVTLSPPEENAGDTYEWRHGTPWDLNEVPFSTDYQIDDAPVGTYWVSTTHPNGSIDDSWVTTIAPPIDPVLIPVDVYPPPRFVGGQATVVMIAHPPQPPANACDVQYKWWQGSSVDDPAKFTIYDPDNNPFQIDLFDIPDTATFWFEMSWHVLDASGCPTEGSRTTRRSEYIEITVTCDPPAAVSATAIPDPHVRKNELVTLYASGWGKLLTYKWYHGLPGNRLTPAGDGRTLYKTFPGDSDKLDMWVEVVDACDNVASAPLQIYVCKPSIVTEPAQTTVIRSGQTKQISVVAEAASGQPLLYQWYNADVDGRGTTAPIPGETSASLDVTAPAGKYYCRLSSMCRDNAEAVSITRTAQVDVCAPPVIAWTTPSQDVRENETRAIQVEATGPELTYQWYRGETGDINNPIVGATGPLYELFVPDTTKVWVRVSSQTECSIDSPTITLTVCKAPQLNSGPTANPPIVFSGGTSTLTVSATPNSAAPLHYTWYEVTDLGNVLVCSGQPTCTTESLTAAKTYFVRITSGTLISIDSPQVTVSVCAFAQSIPGAPDAQVSANTPYFLTLPLDPSEGNTITWYRGASGNTATPVQTGPSPQLIINDSVSGQYWAKVERGGCTSSSTTTNVFVCVPKVVAQPLPGSIISGESHTMTFGAGGTDAPLTYQWYRGEPGNDRDPVVGQTSPSITVSPTVATTYFCRVTSNCGRILDSNATVVNVCTRPVINAASGSSIAPGQNGLVSVNATGSNLTYQWYRGASGNTTQLISGAVNAAYYESPAATSQYWCRITSNGSCWIDSATVTISVCAVPSITTQPANSTINNGQSVTLSVVASPATGYQWYRGTSGELSLPVSGATSATLNTGALTADTQYWVRVINGLCSANSATATVTVCQLSVSVNSAQTQKSQLVTLTAGVSNARSQSLTYTWYQGASGDTSQLYGGGMGVPSIAVNPAVTTSYWVRVSDGTCIANSNTATVNVCIPRITTQPAGTMIAPGGSHTLSVVSDLPGSTYQWYTGGTAISGATNSSLTVSPSSATSYWVRVTGTCGQSVDSTTATITICDPPAITSSSPGVWIARGSSWNIGVGATGTNLTYQWYTGTSGNTSAPISGATNWSYSASPQNTTSYWARVSGTCGSVNSPTITISVCTTSTITAQPQSVSIFSGSTATLSVTATQATTSPMSYQWYRGASGDTSVPVGTASTYTTPALTSNTNYWVRVSCGTCTPVDSQTATVSMCLYPQTLTAPPNVQTAVGEVTRISGVSPSAGNGYQFFRGASGDISSPLTPGYQAANYVDVGPSVTTQYWYRVQNGSCVSSSGTVTVNVCVPQITTQPASVTIPSSTPTTLTVAANTAGVTYQWYIGASGTTTSPISGATSSSLTISPASTTSYWARATSTCGRTIDSAAATVTTCQVPVITRQPFSAPINGGQAAYTDVIATGTNLTYQWYLGESGNTSSPVVCGREGCSTSTASSLSLTTWTSIRVWVRVSGMCGSAADSNATWLSVYPSIYAQPTGASANYGSTATIEVGASGAALHYAWKWANGSPVAGAPDAPRLMLSSITANVSVFCEVTSGNATRTSSAADVTLCNGPYIYNVQVSPAGGNCRFVVVNVANPYAISNYLWYQGPRGDTLLPLTQYNGSSQLYVCPASTTTYWCRVVGEDGQGGACYTDTQAVTAP